MAGTGRMTQASIHHAPKQHKGKGKSRRDGGDSPRPEKTGDVRRRGRRHDEFRLVRQSKREKVSSTKKYRKGAWTHEECLAFLKGLQLYGHGRWKEIGILVATRSNQQIKSHGQKLAQRWQQGINIFHELEIAQFRGEAPATPPLDSHHRTRSGAIWRTDDDDTKGEARSKLRLATVPSDIVTLEKFSESSNGINDAPDTTSGSSTPGLPLHSSILLYQMSPFCICPWFFDDQDHEVIQAAHALCELWAECY